MSYEYADDDRVCDIICAYREMVQKEQGFEVNDTQAIQGLLEIALGTLPNRYCKEIRR